MNLYKELQEKLSEHKPTDVDELILDDLFENVKAFTEDNKKDFEKYTNLLHLSLNGFGLESLKNFPKIPTLQVLEIRTNSLTGQDFAKLKELYPELYKLKVGENPIKDLNVFKSLSDSNIIKLELKDTPAAEGKDYRKTIFSFMTKLECVDGITKDGEEASSTIYEDDEDEMGESADEDEFDGEDDEEMEEYEDDEDDKNDDDESDQ
jgi:hypothetical protein